MRRRKVDLPLKVGRSWKARLHEEGRHFIIVDEDGLEWMIRPATRGFYWCAILKDQEADRNVPKGEGLSVFDAIAKAKVVRQIR